MTILGSLSVRGLWDGRKLDSGIDKSRRKTKQMKDSLGGLKTAMTTLGVGLTVAGFQRFAASQFDAIDSLAKTSRILGLTTESLGAYQFAAGLSGLSTETLNTSLEKMRDTIGAAAMGEAGPAGALAALGLDPGELAAANDPLERIQRSLNKIGDQNQKLAIVRDIFGRGGAQVLNLFESNLAGVRKEYEAMGLAVSSEEAKRVEEFNDKLSVLSQRFSSVGRSLLIDATPVALEALQGAQIVLEGIGLIGGQKSAKEKAREASGQSSGSFAGLLGRGRQTAVEAVGAVGSLAFADFGLAFKNARIGSQMSRAERNRQRQYRQPQVDSRPVQLVPANL